MKSSRLTILTDEEIYALYELPEFDDEERTFLFELDTTDMDYLNSLKDISRKINFILQLGYYKAINYFFQFSFQKRKQDVLFILKQLFPGEPFPKKQILRKYHYENRLFIMNKYGITEPDNTFNHALAKKAKVLAKRHALPKFVLQELLDYSLNSNVLRPAYTTMQDLVSTALKQEQKRLSNKLYVEASNEIREQLGNLLQIDELFYSLTLIKMDQKDFSTTEILHTVKKQQKIFDLCKESKRLMNKLGIPKYYTI
ncbi:DUF4158 domain-containing protein [Photobacterium damselae]|uniref:DUF4158 domain-containing protein n=1 Tax=Photobacterium damselae TaxID=38293 RepID=UPI0030F4AB53